MGTLRKILTFHRFIALNPRTPKGGWGVVATPPLILFPKRKNSQTYHKLTLGNRFQSLGAHFSGKDYDIPPCPGVG